MAVHAHPQPIAIFLATRVHILSIVLPLSPPFFLFSFSPPQHQQKNKQPLSTFSHFLSLRLPTIFMCCRFFSPDSTKTTHTPHTSSQ